MKVNDDENIGKDRVFTALRKSVEWGTYSIGARRSRRLGRLRYLFGEACDLSA